MNEELDPNAFVIHGNLGRVIREKVLKERMRRAKKNISLDEPFYLPYEEILEISIGNHELHYMDKPKPPVKKIIDIMTSGFLHHHYHQEKEYNFHAPEYLSKLKAWELEGIVMNSISAELRCMGILIKDECEKKA